MKLSIIGYCKLSPDTRRSCNREGCLRGLSKHSTITTKKKNLARSLTVPPEAASKILVKALCHIARHRASPTVSLSKGIQQSCWDVPAPHGTSALPKETDGTKPFTTLGKSHVMKVKERQTSCRRQEEPKKTGQMCVTPSARVCHFE